MNPIPQMLRVNSRQKPALQCQFPVMPKEMTDGEIADYHVRKLYQSSLNSIRQIPQLNDPNDEQTEWYEEKMKATSMAWERWFVGIYFTEEQKKQLGITYKDIVGKELR